MTTKQQMIEILENQFPTLKVGSDDSGYTELSADEYDATIIEWANAKLAREAKAAEAETNAAAKAAAQAKLAALGLTVEDLQALGL
jgi:hypothetical protein